MTKIDLECKEPGIRLDVFISDNSDRDYSRSFYKRLITNGMVTVNGKTVSKAGTVLDKGDMVAVDFPEPENSLFDRCFSRGDFFQQLRKFFFIIHDLLRQNIRPFNKAEGGFAHLRPLLPTRPWSAARQKKPLHGPCHYYNGPRKKMRGPLSHCHK